MLKGSCHCGAIQLTVPSAPPVLNQCHCSICYKYGTRWGYYNPKEVEIARDDSEARDTYRCNRKTQDFCRCQQCGCVYAWIQDEKDYPRMGVNMRMFDEADLKDVEVKDSPGPK